MPAEHIPAQPAGLPYGRRHMCATPPAARRHMSAEHTPARGLRPVGLPGGRWHMSAEHTPVRTRRPAGREVAHVH